MRLAIDGGGGVQIGEDVALDSGRHHASTGRRSLFLSESTYNLSRAALIYPAWFTCPGHGPMTMVSIDSYCD